MSSDRESFTFRVGISLVIHNRLEEVKITLNSLSQAITDLDRVCLVDNASSNSEDLDRLKKSYQLFHWIENSDNRGYAAAHHQALNWLMEQNCQYCLLFNPDLTLPKTILDDLSHASRKVKDLWVLSPLLVRDKKEDPIIDSAGLELDGFFRARDRSQGIQKSKAFPGGGVSTTQPVPALCGAMLWIPAQLLPLRPEALVFSTDYFAYFEDMELGMELQRRQVPMGLLPHIKVVHRRGGMSRLQKFTEKDWISNPKQIRGAILNRYRTLFRHNRLLFIFLRYPRLVPYEMIRWIYILFRKPWLLKLIPEIFSIFREETHRKRKPPIRRPD